MFKANLRLRSTFSDGKLTIPGLVDFYGTRGYGAIAIADRVRETRTVRGRAADYLRRSLSASTFPIYIGIIRSEAERAWELYRMVVLAGFELAAAPATGRRRPRIVGLGISSFLAAGDGAEVLTDAIRSQGGVALRLGADVARAKGAGWRTILRCDRDADSILADLRSRRE